MFEKSVLDNGLRIITSTMPGTRSVCMAVFVGAGSRYEADPIAGVSHFIEHMCFKGTHLRPTAKEISEAIEGVGGFLNASTDREMTVFWCKVARPHFLAAFDVVVDMLLHSRFDAQDIDKERQVVLEELNMVNDTPSQRVDVLIDEVVWPDQPLGREVAGTKESVGQMTREHLLDYLAHQYIPSNAVVSIAGEVDHAQVVEQVAGTLGSWTGGAPLSMYAAHDGQDGPRMKREYRKTEQGHLCLAFPGLPAGHPDRYALDLLSVILGEGMSSRLFLEVREKRGLAYDVHSYVSHLADSGTINVYAGLDPKRAPDGLKAILEELEQVKEAIPEAELSKAKELSKGRMLLRMEDTRSVAGWIGGQELLLGQVQTVDEVVTSVDRITAEEVQRQAREHLDRQKLNLAVVGPFRSDRPFRDLLQQ